MDPSQNHNASFNTVFHATTICSVRRGGLIAIGSGGMYALSAARALLAHTELDAKRVATEALKIAGEICIYTNGNIVVETL